MIDAHVSDEDASTLASSAPAEAPARPEAPAPPLRTSGPRLSGAGWLLRTTGVVSILAAAFGVIVAPGARGVASDAWAAGLSRVSSILSYFMALLVMAIVVLGCLELSRSSKVGVASRVIAIGSSGAVFAFAVPSFLVRLPAPVSFALSVAATLSVFAGVWQGLRASRTRAVAIVALGFAMAAVLRLVAWQVAAVLGERTNAHVAIATAAILVEGLGQMAAAAWLGTRGRSTGQALSSLAIAGAFVLTWGAARGASVSAAPWQAALHTALADASGLSPSFRLGALAIFLVVASILLAFVAIVQQRQMVSVVLALCLSLVARGAFDVPLHALAATAASLWMLVAVVDDRGMWRAILEGEPRGA